MDWFAIRHVLDIWGVVNFLWCYSKEFEFYQRLYFNISNKQPGETKGESEPMYRYLMLSFGAPYSNVEGQDVREIKEEEKGKINLLILSCMWT